MSAPDSITVRAQDGGSKFLPHPEGQFAALCVDTIDLGERLESFPGKPRKITNKCAIVFWAGERNADSGAMHEVHAEFTVSMFERAGLRLFLESWRGRSYKEAEAKAGVPLHKLVGQYALVSVEHRLSANKRSYAKIKSIQPLPKQMARPEFDAAYTRDEFWVERKEAYRSEVRQFRAENTAPDEETNGDQGGADDSSLPF